MRKYIKRQMFELLDTMSEAVEMLPEAARDNASQFTNLLADQQEAAMAVGQQIEDSEGEGTKAVQLLEQYCELLWEMSQQPENPEKTDIDRLDQVLGQVKQEIQELPEQFDVVFMPYKASMWDCMESVWQAACDDPGCYPFVVPIPYFDLKDGKIVKKNYEGNQFPPYVPITSYEGFPLEEIHPSAIFIHNPYDEYNIVTRVAPEYFSAELKKVTDRLVYIPYYVTGDAVFVTHRYKPSYENMDFIVTQCEKMIDSYDSNLPRKKFLPFGSPIADRILRLEKEKPAIPEEWKRQLKNGKDFGGDRTVMLNTSISLFMKQRDRFLDKIEYLMNLAKHVEGVTLVWRPHPLLHTTAQTMGLKYAARLAGLEDKFRREKIGVLDHTLDVGETVALCDAYLGETASSMIHMFGIARKPRFYINLLMPQEAEEADNTFLVSGRCQTEEKEYYVLDQQGWILERDKDTAEERLVVRIPGREVVRGRAYRGMELKEDSLWVYPENAEGIFIYQLGTGRMRKLFEPAGETEKRGSREIIQSARDRDVTQGAGDCGAVGNCDAAGNFDAAGDRNAAQGIEDYLTISEECLAAMRSERFLRGNLNHEWYENEKNSVEDFFHFLRTAKEDELKGNWGPYPVWLASLDGSCGKKVLDAVKASLPKSSS